MKTIKGKETNIYLSINETGSTLNVGKTGLILLLEGGHRIDKPDAKIDAEVNTAGGGYVYKAFVLLTKEDLDLLSKYSITDDRLYIYEGTILKGNKIKEYVKCLIK